MVSTVTATSSSTPSIGAAASDQALRLTSWITTFAAGHGFSIQSTTAQSAADDTTDYVIGAQSYAMTTKTDGSAGAVQKLGIPQVDTTGKSLVLAVKISDATVLTELIVYAGVDNFSSFYQWTVQDNGADAQRYFKSGEWSYLTLSFHDAAVTGTPTRSGVTAIRLRGRCTNGNALVVHWQGVGLTPEQSIYPNGVVSISFDDCLSSQYNAALPVLAANGIPATAYLIVDALGTSGFMTLAQCQTLEDDHGWEMAGHSYTLADHAAGLATLSEAELTANLSQMREWLEGNGFTGVRHLAYPLGNFTEPQIAITRRYFDSGRTIISRTRAETLQPANLYRLRSPSLTNSNMPASTWTTEVNKAVANKSWLHLTFHGVKASSPGANDILTSDFTTIIEHIAASGIAVRTVREVLAGQ